MYEHCITENTRLYCVIVLYTNHICRNIQIAVHQHYTLLSLLPLHWHCSFSFSLKHLWNIRRWCLCSWDIQVFSSPFNHNRTIYHLTFYTLQALASERPPSTRNKIPNFHTIHGWIGKTPLSFPKLTFHHRHLRILSSVCILWASLFDMIFVKPSLTG